jgi:hypothetical protein
LERSSERALKTGDHAVLVERAATLFRDVARPEHFTDHLHCCECAEHDRTLQQHDPANLGLDQLHPGWDPMCFATPDAFRYFFPALTRLAVEGREERYFIDQLTFHLVHDGQRNARWAVFTSAQRRFVVELLSHLIETRAGEIDDKGDTDSVLRALEIWGDDATDPETDPPK